MSVEFYPGQYRASGGDLTVSVSPLGLVELADEEFEVHGPRLTRYASNWAWYLGHHYAYRREIGEPQLVFNWIKAFSDWKTNFSFGKGLNFHSPETTSGIVPYLLKEVWEVHNKKQPILNEIGQLGDVSGDVFVKVAYEEPYMDDANIPHEGRIRILPLNPAFCFPEFHPHDRTRLVKFKLKYKFWGTAPDGTRQIMTYTEIMTEKWIEEYINDELLDGSPRPNPLGDIPIAHSPNFALASSPWGLSGVASLIPLNREYNEKVTEISDILNYHVSPVTVLTGAKANALERGANKIWAIPSKDAKIQNLTMDTNFTGPLGYLELIKLAMHEMTGVPVNALGQVQPVSNTSGVALQMQWQPAMLHHNRTTQTYTPMFERINELIIKHAFIYAPELVIYSPFRSSLLLKPGQVEQLDPTDSVSYRTYIEWPSPMPMDKLITINEVQALMAMNLESRAGALRALGVQFPEQKLRELFDEQNEDARQDGALELIRAQVQAAIIAMTGIMPGAAGPEPVMGTNAEGKPVPQQPIVNKEIAQQVQELAFGMMPANRVDFESDDPSS